MSDSRKRARFMVDIEVDAAVVERDEASGHLRWDELCDIVRTSLHHCAGAELADRYDSAVMVEQVATRVVDR